MSANRPPSDVLLAGLPPYPSRPSQQSLRQSVRPSQPQKHGEHKLFEIGRFMRLTTLDAENEELRVQVNALRYELENLKQERELAELRHEKELRDLQLKADADFRKAQVGLCDSDCSCGADRMGRAPRPRIRAQITKPRLLPRS